MLRTAQASDATAMADLASIDAEVYKLEEYLSSPTCQGFVVFDGDDLVAWAMARHLEPPTVDSEHAPPGWYLMGVVVRPDRRRHGLGAQLTQMRLEWLTERTHCVRYFTLPDNQASLTLHEEFGFRYVRDGLTIKDLCFNGGPYSLFELALPATQGPGGAPTSSAE